MVYCQRGGKRPFNAVAPQEDYIILDGERYVLSRAPFRAIVDLYRRVCNTLDACGYGYTITPLVSYWDNANTIVIAPRPDRGVYETRHYGVEVCAESDRILVSRDIFTASPDIIINGLALWWVGVWSAGRVYVSDNGIAYLVR